MNLVVTEEAHQWFVKELHLEKKDCVRFFGKYGGKTSVHTGFSVGLEVSVPEQTIAKAEIEEQVYYIEEADDWFFSGYDLLVSYDLAQKEPAYRFKKTTEV